MLREALLFVAGLAALYYGAEWVVRGGGSLARDRGVSPLVVGLTVVSMGTSAPELVVAVVASLRGSGDLAVGNVLGSNMVNIGLILGIAALVSPLAVAASTVRREVPIMVGVTALLYPLIADLRLGRLDGAFLLLVLGGYLLFVVRAAGREPGGVRAEYEEFAAKELVGSRGSSWGHVGILALGLVGLVAGAQALVESALFLARTFGVPEHVIGFTAVAVGTSLPELATSVVAAVRREADIAVGNVIGSNVFNVAAILGTAAVVRPLTVAASVPRLDLPAVLAFSLLLLPVTRSGLTIRRWEGGLLVAAYLAVAALIL